MTRQEYESKLDEINIGIADLEYKKGNYLSSSTMDEGVRNDGINSIDRKISLLKRERFELEDKYNFQKQQEKEAFEQRRNEKILDANVDSYAKREKLKTDYVKAFPNTQLARDLMDGKEVDFKEVIAALKEHKEAVAEEKNSQIEQVEQTNQSITGEIPEASEHKPMTDEEGQRLMMRMGKELYGVGSNNDAQLIENGNLSDEEAQYLMARAGQEHINANSEDNAKAIENNQVSDEEAQNMMTNVGQEQNNDLEFEIETESKGRQLVSKISEASQSIKEKLTANNNKALKAIIAIAAVGAVVLTAGAAVGVTPVAMAASGVAGYGVSQFNKGKKL